MGISGRQNQPGDHQTYRRGCHVEVAGPNHWLLLVEVPQVSLQVFVPLFLLTEGLRASSVRSPR